MHIKYDMHKLHTKLVMNLKQGKYDKSALKSIQNTYIAVKLYPMLRVNPDFGMFLLRLYP